mgnify:CR=1 FL=1
MIVDALINIRPGAQWTLDGDSYEGLNWLDENQTKPTKKELEDEINRLSLQYKNDEYQRQRLSDYPQIKDQLDMLYHDIKNGNLENGEWIKNIELVKAKYPKPTN